VTFQWQKQHCEPDWNRKRLIEWQKLPLKASFGSQKACTHTNNRLKQSVYQLASQSVIQSNNQSMSQSINECSKMFKWSKMTLEREESGNHFASKWLKFAKSWWQSGKKVFWIWQNTTENRLKCGKTKFESGSWKSWKWFAVCFKVVCTLLSFSVHSRLCTHLGKIEIQSRYPSSQFGLCPRVLSTIIHMVKNRLPCRFHTCIFAVKSIVTALIYWCWQIVKQYKVMNIDLSSPKSLKIAALRV